MYHSKEDAKQEKRPSSSELKVFELMNAFYDLPPEIVIDGNGVFAAVTICHFCHFFSRFLTIMQKIRRTHADLTNASNENTGRRRSRFAQPAQVLTTIFRKPGTRLAERKRSG